MATQMKVGTRRRDLQDDGMSGESKGEKSKAGMFLLREAYPRGET